MKKTAASRLPMRKRALAKRPNNFCFGCGQDNGQGMRLKFDVDESKKRVRGTFRLAGRYQGPPKHAHGGIIATLADEAMGKLSRIDGVVALTAEMTVEYLRPVPLGKKIVVEAWPTHQNGRHYFRECAIRDAEGNLLARGRGRFVKIAERKVVSGE